MISKENATILTFLACLALIAVLSGEWMTRPGNLGLWGSIVAVLVIYVIIVGAPQLFILDAALSCARRGYTPPSGWWNAAWTVLVMQFGAGLTLVAGAIAGEEGLFSLAAVILIVAGLAAVACGLAASRVAYKDQAWRETSS